VRRAVTANESGNTGIRRLNLELGYVPGVGEYRLERQGRATLGG